MKLSYSQLAVAVDRAYTSQPCYDLTTQQVDKLSATIAALIEASGWTETEYWKEWLERSEKGWEGLDKAPEAPYIESDRRLS